MSGVNPGITPVDPVSRHPVRCHPSPDPGIAGHLIPAHPPPDPRASCHPTRHQPATGSRASYTRSRLHLLPRPASHAIRPGSTCPVHPTSRPLPHSRPPPLPIRTIRTMPCPTARPRVRSRVHESGTVEILLSTVQHPSIPNPAGCSLLSTAQHPSIPKPREPIPKLRNMFAYRTTSANLNP